ncbi:PHD finger protein At3g20280 [Linum perenne]
MSLQAARDHTFRPFITQTTSTSVHQPVQTVKSVYSNHNGIAKIVQKLLQPKLPQYPTWIPPSREYMSKALTCQSCSLTVNEVETVAICDACEKGFHLKCLESVSQKGIPRTTEWHCMKCTSLSNGKPFPPKYGRVMRSMTPPKGPASATQGGAQSFSDNKLVNMGQRGNQEKMSSVLQSVTEPGTADCSNLESASGTKISSERGTPRNSITSMGKDTDMAHCAGTLPNDKHNVEQNQQGLTYAPASDHNVEQSEQVVVCAPSDAENSVEQSKQGVNNAPLASECSVKQNVAHPHLTKNPEPVDSVSNNMQLSSEAYHTVEWVRNAFKVVDGKAFYESCCVGGVMYQVMDHALFCSSHGKLIPFKLQTMWEDVKTGSKWVTVSRYYLREDLPEDVGQPFSPESNEVYDSNHETSVMAGSIQGSCKVLPPVKYKEETERRSQIESGTKNNSEPVFLCKYVHSCHHTNLLVVLVS